MLVVFRRVLEFSLIPHRHEKFLLLERGTFILDIIAKSDQEGTPRLALVSLWDFDVRNFENF